MQLKLLNSYIEAVGQERLAAMIEEDSEPQSSQEGRSLESDGSVYVNLDQWDGYQAERREIAREIKAKNVKNFVTITGDLHSYTAGYLKENFDDPLEEPIGTCFMAGSVTFLQPRRARDAGRHPGADRGRLERVPQSQQPAHRVFQLQCPRLQRSGGNAGKSDLYHVGG